MAFYASPRLYIQDATDMKDRIDRLQNVVALLIQAMEGSALEDDVEEYRLDDGQTRINVRKRSVEQMAGSIDAIQGIINRYQNQINGRQMRLLDHEATRLLKYC